jgi:2-oxo-4-hydroxy-4-carboxy-5-ureidoimidazoline decarboxylase
VDLLEIAESNWYACEVKDWLEAFSNHPKIGDLGSLKEKYRSTAHLAAGEQASVNQASEKILQSLADLNKLYENKFGYIFIVFATGKSADEMLALLKARLQNDPEKEIGIAMDEQNKITRLRLEKIFV